VLFTCVHIIDPVSSHSRPPPRGPARPRGIRLSVIGISNTTSWQVRLFNSPSLFPFLTGEDDALGLKQGEDAGAGEGEQPMTCGRLWMASGKT
jgi:hypothetical protein